MWVQDGYTAIFIPNAKSKISFKFNGWGGRDRTSEWRNQNPLPYHLATPHQALGNGGDTSVRGFPRVVPVYRERRGISTARRGKIPKAPLAPRHALYERYATPFPMDAPPPS